MLIAYSYSISTKRAFCRMNLDMEHSKYDITMNLLLHLHKYSLLFRSLIDILCLQNCNLFVFSVTSKKKKNSLASEIFFVWNFFCAYWNLLWSEFIALHKGDRRYNNIFGEFLHYKCVCIRWRCKYCNMPESFQLHTNTSLRLFHCEQISELHLHSVLVKWLLHITLWNECIADAKFQIAKKIQSNSNNFHRFSIF